MNALNTTDLNGSIEGFFSGLFGGDIIVKEMEDAKPIGDPRIVASYLAADESIHHFLVFDLSLANTVGASLSFFPPTLVTTSNEAGEVPENIQENLAEVMNISSNLVPHRASERITFGKLWLPGEEFEEEHKSVIDNPTSVHEVKFERYPGGQMAIAKIED